MAVDLGKFISSVKENIELDALSHKVIAVDAYNTIYQFLSIIRQPDGTPLLDSKNRVTSHLSGLLYRTINLLEFDITPVFVFDGLPPVQKQRVLEARMKKRKEALEGWNKAKEQGMVEEARAYAVASTKINKEIVASAKELLGYMGVPYFQANSEGEAQGSEMARSGLVYAVASQDYDSFLFSAETVLRNITISGRRKLPGKNIYIEVKPERIFLNKLLSNLNINQKQLIWLGMLMGTDFNTGVDRVGPKTALKIVSQKKDLKEITEYVKQKYNFEWDNDPNEVEQIFLKPDVTKMTKDEFDAMLKSPKPDREKIIRFMCDEHNFSLERIGKSTDRLFELKGKKGQKGINTWL